MSPPSPGHQLVPAPAAVQAPAGQPIADKSSAEAGLTMAITAYTIWGLSVVFYKWLASVNALEVIGHRGLWSVVCVGLFLAMRHRLGEVVAAFKDWRAVATLAASAGLLIFNWGIFVWATGANEVLAVSFGYFINPIFSIVLGVVILGERLNRWQMAAVALSLAAIGLQAYGLGGIPWISLGLAGTFALYGYLRKRVNVAATPGQIVESALFLLPSIALIGYFNMADTGTLGGLSQGFGTMALLALTGPMTAVPLVLFAAATRRLTLTTVGLLQYIVPSLHFVMAVFVFAEPLNTLRLVTFILIWAALALLSFAMLRDRSKKRTA